MHALHVILHIDLHIGIQQFTHIRNPVTLSVGECIEFTARPSSEAVGNWTWRKDTIELNGISKGTLSISDVIVTDSAYYSAEVETKSGRRELFQFWLFVKGIRW